MDNIYNRIKSKFLNANQYHKNSQIQNQVRKLLLTKIINYSKTFNFNIKNILNLGVRNLHEPLELNKIFSPTTIDVCDIALKIKNLTNINNINIFNINFDTDLNLINNNYDLIFSNMSFQWSQNLKLLIQNISIKLNNNSILAFSIILNNNFYQIKKILRINKMYNMNSILYFINIAKLKCLYQKNFYLNICFNNFKELAIHLKSTGINTYTGNENQYSYKTIKNLYLNPNKFNLSYHIGIFICFKE